MMRAGHEGGSMKHALGAMLKIERKGVDFVPHDERYGGAHRLFTIWFSVNMSIVCLTVGTIGVFAGLSFGWVVLALLFGNVIGTVFMAAHSAQGPHLGIPQMIQSRAQFGVVGAAVPLVAVVITYTLYLCADAVVVKASLASLIGISNQWAIIVFGIATLVVAFVGYELIHKLGYVLSVVSTGLMLACFFILLLRHHEASPPMIGPFKSAVFIATLTQSAAWSLTFGPYVADYSRYLPASITARRTFLFTAAGNLLGTMVMMTLGAYMASFFPKLAADPGLGIASLFPGFNSLIVILIVVGVFQGNVLNLYSAYMSATTVYTATRRHRSHGLGAKSIVMLMVSIVAAVIAITTMNDFSSKFGDMLSIMGYLLVPWSAINIADYYLVRIGRYSVEHMFDVDGIYKRFNWVGLSTYFLAVICELPFARLTWYTGSLSTRVGADIAWMPGLILPFVLFPLLERRKLRRWPEPAALNLS
jgi:nucleobase:cation symporter-1, NCS1 family